MMRLFKLLVKLGFPLSRLVVVLGSPLIVGGPLLAQEMGAGITDRVPATIVLVDELDDAPQGAVILRRSDRHPHDVIMIARREAKVQVLSAAVFTLLVTRSLLGDVPEAEVRIPVLQATGPRAWRKRTVPRLGRVLRNLTSAEPGPVRGVGVVPSVTVWLPADYRIRLRAAGAATRDNRS